MTWWSQARVAVAGLVATILAALTLAPLLQGFGWLLACFVIVALLVGIGITMRQVTRAAPLVVISQVLMLVITLTALFARETSLWGVLPGPASWQALSALLDDGLAATQEQTPPADATRGLLLLICGGIGLIGLLVDIIAVTLRRPAAAGLPLLAVYCVPTAILPGGIGWLYFMVAGAGYLLLVGSDAPAQVRSWGRILGTVGPDRVEGSLGGPLSGVRMVGVISLAAAVTLPTFVPGLGERLIGPGAATRDGTGNSTIKVINPILDLRAHLASRSDTVVISYTSDVQSPQPLRIVTDDQFTGEVWQPSTGSMQRTQRVQDGLPPAPGLGSAVKTRVHTTQIDVGNLAQTYLPLPYPATQVDVDGTWLWDPETLNVVGEGVTTQGLFYRVRHLSVEPTPAQLSNAPPAPATVLRRYTGLPDDLPASIRQTARTVAGNGTAYDRARRLQQWFRSGGGFTYSQTLPGNGRADSGENAVAAFLRDRVGYCVQFSSAMAVMARTLGIPARVAVGFLPGTQAKDGSWKISLRDAHAWPELYFAGVGWVRFEPTPATRTGSPPAWTLPLTQQGPEPSASTPRIRPSAEPSAETPPEPQEPSPAADATSPVQRLLGAVPWQALGITALVVLLLAAPLLASTAVHRRRWAGTRSPQDRAEAAWEELRQRLADLGVRWASSWTPRALQLRLTRERDLDQPPAAALARLVSDLENARYAAPGTPVREVDELRRDVEAVVAAVTASVPAADRYRARWLPPSGLAALAGLGRRMDTAADQAGRRASALRSQLRSKVGAGQGGHDRRPPDH